MTDQHITMIDEVPSLFVTRIRFAARCYCGWASSARIHRRAAADAARMHRIDTRVQAL